jgi:hypothetical protein
MYQYLSVDLMQHSILLTMIKNIRITILLILFFVAGSVVGQSYIGVFAGLNSSKLSGDPPEKASYKILMGLNLGLSLDIKLNKSLMLSIQPSYSQEGTKISYTLKNYDKPVDSANIRLNYFSLPAYLKVKSTNQRFYALAGIETGFLLNSYVKSHDIKEDICKKVTKINVAIHFGAGYRIPIGRSHLFIELRYAQGLANLTDEVGDYSYIPRIKTTGFKLFVGYEIPLSKTKN